MDEYLKEGEGYIGIGLGFKDEVVSVPGDPKDRHAIRVTQVQKDSPGRIAGIQLNDLIVGLGDEVWHGVEASPIFRESIKSMKPNTEVRLTILRNAQVIHLNVKLARRPLSVDMFFNGQNTDPDATESAAKEAYFRRWLSLRKVKK